MAKNSLGRIGFIFKGDYDSGSQYTPMDVVYYEGSSYICVKETFNNLPIDINYWFKLVEKGAAGDGFNNANYNEKTGILTFTNPDGSTVEVQLPLNTSELKKLQGTSFHITNSAEAPMKISPRGNDIEQETREGYNKFNKNNIVNGSFVVDKVIANASWCYAVLEGFEVGETYTTSGGRSIISFFNGDTNLSYVDILNTQFTIPENTTKVYMSTLIANKDVFQVVKGTAEKPYEQYGAMPSLAFPSPVKHVGGKVKSYNLAYLEAEGQFRGYSTGAFTYTANYNSYIAKVNENINYSSQYTGEATGVSNLCFFDKSMNYLSGLAYTGEDKSFTTPENCAYVTMAVHINVTDYMLVEGTSSKPYLPYGEAGNVYDIAKVNKNICYSDFEQGDINTSTGANQAGTNYVRSVSFIPVEGGKSITASYTNSKTTSSQLVIYEFDKNKAILGFSFADSFYLTTKLKDNTKYIKLRFKDTTATLSNNSEFQVEYGENKTDYIAHQQENRSLDLTNLPLYSKNDYIRDNKVYNEWGKYIFTGNETNIGISELGNGLYQFYIGIIPNLLKSSSEIVAYSNCFKGVKFEDRRNYDDCIYGYSGDTNIRVTTSKYSTVDTFKAKLQELYNAGTPVYIIYKLATPTETEITDKKVIAQLEELYNTYAYDEVTNISVDNPILSVPLILDVEYYIKTVLELETKVSYEEYSVLEKRVKALENAILSLGGNV